MPTTLPDLSAEYPITPEQTAQFQKNGHILLRGVLSAEEIAAYRPALVRAADKYCTETRPMAERDTYGKAFLQIMNLWLNDADVKKYVVAKRFAKIAADLIGVDGVRLYHDQALFKEPKGGHTPWHQDQYYWPFVDPNPSAPMTATMWMPLSDAAADMGTMTFASGSHIEGYASKIPISDESEELLKQYVADKGYQLSQSGAMKAGDVTFHAGWTMHSAPGNQTDRMREAMTIIYYADGAVIAEPDNPNRQNDLDSWFPGAKPGDIAITEINPLLYSR